MKYVRCLEKKILCDDAKAWCQIFYPIFEYELSYECKHLSLFIIAYNDNLTIIAFNLKFMFLHASVVSKTQNVLLQWIVLSFFQIFTFSPKKYQLILSYWSCQIKFLFLIKQFVSHRINIKIKMETLLVKEVENLLETNYNIRTKIESASDSQRYQIIGNKLT